MSHPARVTISLPLGVGDLLLARAQLDGVAHEFEEIRVRFAREFAFYRTSSYRHYLTSLGRWIYADAPYVIDGEYGESCASAEAIHQTFGSRPRWPRLGHVLCPEPPPATPRPYLVLHTKVRFLPSQRWCKLKSALYAVLKDLSARYDLVLLGERELEPHHEWCVHGPGLIYSIYDDYRRSGLPLLDRTVDTLAAEPYQRLARIQQDSCVLHGAAASINVGIGGAFCLAASLARTLCIHDHPPIYVDPYLAADAPEGSLYTDDWPTFRRGLLGLL